MLGKARTPAVGRERWSFSCIPPSSRFNVPAMRFYHRLPQVKGLHVRQVIAKGCRTWLDAQTMYIKRSPCHAGNLTLRLLAIGPYPCTIMKLVTVAFTSWLVARPYSLCSPLDLSQKSARNQKFKHHFASPRYNHIASHMRSNLPSTDTAVQLVTLPEFSFKMLSFRMTLDPVIRHPQSSIPDRRNDRLVSAHPIKPSRFRIRLILP